MTFRSRIATLFCGLLLSLPVLAAEPGVREIYQAADAGRMAEAQQMIDQVLKAHPDSAKAHYIAAELLTREGRLAQARDELKKAERLAPGLPFARPATVNELRAHLQATSLFGAGTLVGSAPPPHEDLPWGMILSVVVMIVLSFLLARLLLSRQPQVQVMSQPGGIPGPVSPGPVYGSAGYGGYAQPAPATGGIGSGILGGVATGLAVGAGVAVGETLIHRVLDGGRREDVFAQPVEVVVGGNALAADNSFNDMGGQDFGIVETGSSWDDGGIASSGWDGNASEWS